MSFVTISQPSGAGTNNVFLPSGGLTGCSGTGPFGLICASGTANPKGGEDAAAVHARIYPAGTTTWPGNPPADAVRVNLAAGQTNWAFDSTSGTPDVPCARCGTSSAPVGNVLVVWATYATQAAESVGRTFAGVCASATDCGGSAAMGTQSFSLAMPMNAAREMVVQADGFTAEALQAFNGTWKLALGEGNHGVWDNGGDGKKKTRVELRLDIKQPAAWQLTFKRGRAKALYVQSKTNWGWSRANDMIFVGAEATKKGAPLVVHVTPA